ncbi:MAG: cold-shock protein [Candidatus Buchananbacteria bacterium RIFCSPLOWO2_01_FULL_56_15]|uniref:Cold-shock protein n=2 Tax=Candidatus Buchananiibacteriota TaxID=1817903 RepID=A0A1G1YE52_9BACT|nr:MAG: cold-shock protein [Candidatus Buchananbacteria bacterium RIFCSPHIGHO2_02_FULL_56_16]OGY54656.1 MAG: cold-shock protein [Candidatus Buchananbacteria bacterium RIFCSPLOWO2_01_FULL_56_15]
MQGIIKKILADKKCGFISQEGVEKDVFFSGAKLDGISFEDLKEGDAVTFEVEAGDRGPAAVGVKKA